MTSSPQTSALTPTSGSGLSRLELKHKILREWGLEPPKYQDLRPLSVLLSTVHTVFPPRFNVPAHAYFRSWTAVRLPRLSSAEMGRFQRSSSSSDHDEDNPRIEELRKATRKLRFFLHPDKLPADLSDEARHVCEVLWEVTSHVVDENKAAAK
jgi:hypothetical protein